MVLSTQKARRHLSRREALDSSGSRDGRLPIYIHVFRISTTQPRITAAAMIKVRERRRFYNCDRAASFALGNSIELRRGALRVCSYIALWSFSEINCYCSRVSGPLWFRSRKDIIRTIAARSVLLVIFSLWRGLLWSGAFWCNMTFYCAIEFPIANPENLELSTWVWTIRVFRDLGVV